MVLYLICQDRKCVVRRWSTGSCRTWPRALKRGISVTAGICACRHVWCVEYAHMCLQRGELLSAAYIVMAYIVVAYIVVAYIVVAYIVMVTARRISFGGSLSRSQKFSIFSSPPTHVSVSLCYLCACSLKSEFVSRICVHKCSHKCRFTSRSQGTDASIKVITHVLNDCHSWHVIADVS